ncbi:MAG: nucleotidyltransferase domain-containing protein [Candidatus Bathyarchaeia archaeon]
MKKWVQELPDSVPELAEEFQVSNFMRKGLNLGSLLVDNDMDIKVEIENLPKELRKRGLKKELFEICQKNDIVFMAVFGSFVRGEHKKGSDVDIAVEFEKNSGKAFWIWLG